MSTTDNAVSQAYAQLEEIERMMRRMSRALKTQNDEKYEAAQEEVQANILSVEVRPDWITPGDTEEYGEFRICLCTGGPAVQIVGELDVHQTPETVDLQAQDWYTPWESVNLSQEQEDALLAFCGEFYYGS